MCGDEIFRGLAMMFWLKSDQLLFFTAQLPTGAVTSPPTAKSRLCAARFERADSKTVRCPDHDSKISTKGTDLISTQDRTAREGHGHETNHTTQTRKHTSTA